MIRTILRPLAVGCAVLLSGAVSALGGYEAHAHAVVPHSSHVVVTSN